MSRPDWKDAPEWARWMAQDESGAWWWHEIKPTPAKRQGTLGGWVKPWAYRQAVAAIATGWQETLEKVISQIVYRISLGADMRVADQASLEKT